VPWPPEAGAPDASVIQNSSQRGKMCMTGGAHGGQGRPIFLPLGAVHYLNGHGLKVCSWADPN
jgi:hypothetical protein